MDKVIEGALKFMEEDFKENKELFMNLAHSQSPHTLFIGCSDSRVVPNLITNSAPGELFVIRNIANIVPPYRIANEFLATTSAIEYALNVLKVKNVVICGHSNCGGCASLYYDDYKFSSTPNVKKWLSILDPIKEQVNGLNLKDPLKKSWLTEGLSIINSLENLYTFPGVKKAVDEGRLKIYGWLYVIEKGLVYYYDEKTSSFAPLKEEFKK
ncbi:MAG: carbonic anhydrase [Campylobacter sp.]|nr:carbonic anhydrase [Campylobacter sp.]